MKNKKHVIPLIIAVILVVLTLVECNHVLNARNEKQSSGKSEQTVADGTLHYDYSEFLEGVPEWTGFAFCYINDNQPDFEDEEIWTTTQESLSRLDDLGRCGTADSCIGQDGMPTGERGDISEIHPTGWHSDRYDFVEGESLYNRCHLIAHQLSGDDAVDRNLITGTSYMNRDGMLHFENAISEYVRTTGNHVMYRVTPIFVGDELIARGVHMQAISVEDGGEGIAFNVFCYNAQPGVDIDYLTGDNELSQDTSLLEAYQSGDFAMMGNTKGEIPSGEGGAVRTYMLNTNSGKFHYPDCKSVEDISPWNRQDEETTRGDLISRGFTPCGSCNP